MSNNTESNYSYAPDFELPGTQGDVYHLSRYLESHRAIAVVFIGNQSPTVKATLPKLKQLQAEFEGQGFILIGINAYNVEKSPAESFENMKAFAVENQLNFPYIRDYNQDVAECFGVTVVPEAFLIDKKAVIRYRGLIEDANQQPLLKNAITALLNGDVIEPSCTQAVGSPLE